MTFPYPELIFRSMLSIDEAFTCTMTSSLPQVRGAGISSLILIDSKPLYELQTKALIRDGVLTSLLKLMPIKNPIAIPETQK